MTFNLGSLQPEVRNKTVRCISVTPSGGRWLVLLDEIAQELVFRSGPEAETAAKRIGQQLASDGHRAEIRVFLRSGELAGRFVCAPGMAAPRLARDEERHSGDSDGTRRMDTGVSAPESIRRDAP